MDAPMTIIGTGGGPIPEDVWRLLLGGEDGIVDVPADR